MGRFRSRKAGVTLVEITSAAVCVGVLGAVTIGGTQATRARLTESVLNRQAVMMAQNKIEELRTGGRMAMLARGHTTQEVTFNDGTKGIMSIWIEGPDIPPVEYYPIESLDGTGATMTEADKKIGSIMVGRVMGNNDLSHYFMADNGLGSYSFDLVFPQAIKDNSTANDYVGEVIVVEIGGEDKLRLQGLDVNGNPIGNSVLIGNGIDTKAPVRPGGQVVSGLGKRNVNAYSIDLSKKFGSTISEIYGLRVTSPTLAEAGFSALSGPDIKIFGVDTVGVRNTLAEPRLWVSGPGTEAGNTGPVMLNALYYDRQEVTRLIYPSGVKNLNVANTLTTVGAYSSAPVIWKATVEVAYLARTLTGTKDRKVILNSDVTFGSQYY